MPSKFILARTLRDNDGHGTKIGIMGVREAVSSQFRSSTPPNVQATDYYYEPVMETLEDR
jgi:hypothetical protein